MLIPRFVPTGVALLLAATGLAAQARTTVPVGAAEDRQMLWIIEMTGPSVVEGSTTEQVQRERAALRDVAARAGVPLRERVALGTLVNGMSVRATQHERDRLAQLPGVKAVHAAQIFRAPRPLASTGGAAVQLANALRMTGVDIAQERLGLSGAGVKVGIIDTGVDFDHPDLGGSGRPGSATFPTARVAYGQDFVGDDYDADVDGSVPRPDPNPDDCAGHGTHVAGIVGANGRVKGVAPQVTLGAYRVFGCNGTTSSDIVIAALERAYADGMQIVNLSLGSKLDWPTGPYADATTRLARKGLIIVSSAGNDGPGGNPPDALYATGSPGNSPDVISVASFENTAAVQKAFTVSPDGRPIGYGNAGDAPPAPTSGSLPLLRTGSATAPADACQTLAPGSLRGAAALVRRGGCTFYIKAMNAQAAGAAAVVFYDNAAGFIVPTVAGDPALAIPAVIVTAQDGALLDSRVAAGPVTLTWTGSTTQTPNPFAGLISTFSSYGPPADLSFKPNLGAPGGMIYSTYPLESGGYMSLSGTSMASPHVAGAVALMLQARPWLKVRDILPLLQNAAVPAAFGLKPALGLLESVHRQGAGMIDVVHAITANVVAEPSQLALGESEQGPARRRITLTNRGNAAVTYDLSSLDAVATGPNTVGADAYVVSGFFITRTAVAFSASSVTVPAGGRVSVDVTITAPSSLGDQGLYGGYLRLVPREAGGQSIHVPFFGFQGDYQSLSALTPGGYGFPWLVRLAAGTYTRQSDGAIYSMVGQDVPIVLAHLDHQSRQLRLEAVNQDTGRTYVVSTEDYVTRNATPNGFFAWTWDGTVSVGHGKHPHQWRDAPNGRYVLRMVVFKALGDWHRASDWESWQSPSFTIAR